MTQVVYLWNVSGKTLENVSAALLETRGGIVDCRKKGATGKDLEFRREFGDRYYPLYWAYTGTRTIAEARRKLTSEVHFYNYLCNWIRDQNWPTIMVDGFSSFDLGLAGKLGEFLEKDGFIVTEWEKRKKGEAQMGLFDRVAT